MKNSLFLLSALCLVQIPLHAQVTVVAPTSAPADVVVVRPAIVMHRQLSTAPKVVVVTQAPQEATSTTKTTTVVETTGQPTRVYNAERNVVIVEDQGQSRELPYVTLPVLFEKGTAKLLDNESRAALQQGASALANVIAGAFVTFDAAGHLVGYQILGYVAVGFFGLTVLLAAELRNAAPHVADASKQPSSAPAAAPAKAAA